LLALSRPHLQFYNYKPCSALKLGYLKSLGSSLRLRISLLYYFYVITLFLITF